MATNFPTSVDVLTNPVSNDSLNSPSHSAQHANANDAIEAIEGYLLTGAGAAGLVKVIPTSATNGSVAATGNITFSGVSNFTINGCFTSLYDNYKLYISVDSGTANNEIVMQLVTSGTPNTGNYMFSSSGGSDTVAETNWPLTFITGFGTGSSELTLLRPAVAIHTTAYTQWTYDDGGTFQYSARGGRHRSATSFDGIKFSGPATMTGTVRVYGCK